jgi:ATP-dependent DNA helicase DinG
VWISTYTRNLQRQIDGELDRLFPDPLLKARRVVIRKGRENYLCLLNLEEAVARRGAAYGDVTGLGLVARWAGATRDGDMMGGDFPAWLADLVGWRVTQGLTDRRGECIYSACRHYRRCFIERNIRRARRAEIVVANHALVMAQAAAGGLDDRTVPTRLIFDEGHHLFDAADSAFSARLGGQETADLRRWLIGAEGGARSRARGLQQRIGDIAVLDDKTGTLVTAIAQASLALPGADWRRRILDDRPQTVAETLFARIRQQVYARTTDTGSPYDLEADTAPPVDGLLDEARRLGAALAALGAPMAALASRLAALAAERTDSFDTPTRNRLDAVGRGLERRVAGQIEPWRAMLQSLETETPELFVDWFSVTRQRGRDSDIAMHRHWVDPTRPFAETVLAAAHGVVVTSATLCDAAVSQDAGWAVAESRTGAAHLAAPAEHMSAPSPFDYGRRTRVFIVTDLGRDDIGQLGAAYRALFVAAGGGALGLFTAIRRLRAVHAEIAPALEAAGYTLLAQHVDTLDASSLVDIFRAEEDSILLGTDAMRDGVDVPGRALRLIVFDRVPWARRSILNRARRTAFTGLDYDDMIVRLRLKQAYGRLIRRADDGGVFVVLDRRMPSRLLGAFPEGVKIERVGIAEAVRSTAGFLAGLRAGDRE